MKQRIITAIVLLIILLPCVIFGKLPWALLVAFLSIGGCYETIHLFGDFEYKKHLYLVVIMSVFVLGAVYLSDTVLVNPLYLFIFLLVVLTISIFDEGFTIEKACFTFLIAALVSGGFHAIYHIRNQLGIIYIIYLAIATFGCDIGAYFAGVTLGKHKLCPRLSPKKTIEGSIGGMLLGVIASVLFGVFFGLKLSVIEMIVVSLILTVTGQLGDLTFSSFKRHYEIKDYSNLFPGHGGVLDRFDSILFNALVLSMCIFVLGVL